MAPADQGYDPGEGDVDDMDALDIDDLFLGGEDGVDPGESGSLFKDIDINLADIMDGIIDEEEGRLSGVISEELGGGVVEAVGGRETPTGRADNDVGAGAAPTPLASPAGGRGKAKSRTARSNPFLVMAQHEREEEQRRLSAGARGRGGNKGSHGHSPSQILSPSVKR